ncbi:MAG: CBS domain-containing protein [Thaumarchaeota archaeon]|nr:CBS domain-containing protein [Nitrososphaerota archaeon]
MILDSPVSEIAREIATVEASATVLEAAKTMVERGRGSLVVTRDSKPIGIVTERDLLRKVVAGNRDPKSTLVGDVMTSPPITIDHTKSVREALDLMNRKKVRRMLVTKDGAIVGVFTPRDVLALNRLCLYCGKQIKSALEFGDEAEPYIECECGARYHKDCAQTVVHCVDCSRTLVTHVEYPEPSETTGG